MADADPSCQLSLQPAVKPETRIVPVSTVARQHQRHSTEWPTQFGAAMEDADPLCQLSQQTAVMPAIGSVAVSTVARQPSTEWPIQSAQLRRMHIPTAN